MRMLRLGAILGAVLVGLGLTAAGGQPRIATVATFAPPNLHEAIAIEPAGTNYLSMAPRGEVLGIAPDGGQSTLASCRVGMGFLLGLALGAAGELYAVLESGNSPGSDR